MNIFYARGDLDGAMALYKEAERLCRELGNVEGLAYSLINQAFILSKQNLYQEALTAAEEAYRLATRHGYAALAKRLQPMLD